MMAPGQTVLVALSGGPDSCALLQALCRLRKRLQCRLAAAHDHHRLRGAEADDDAAHAADFAASLSVPFTQRQADVRGFAAERKLSLEAAARQVRYHLLADAAGELGADLIATGHTADDQAETVLLNILRGSGLDGLAGIAPVRDNIIRPLLTLTRADVLAYCQASGIEYRSDSSNQDLRFTRNRIRHELLPALQAAQPAALAALCRIAELVRGDVEVLESLSARAFARSSQETADGRSLSLDELADLPIGLRRRVLRLAVARVQGHLHDVDMERMEAVVNLAGAGRTGAVIQLPGGVTAERAHSHLTISRRPAAPPAPARQWSLQVPGKAELPELGLRLTAGRSQRTRISDDPLVAVLDAHTLKCPLLIRTRRPGDRFVPLGMSQPKKLQDFFVDERIPAGSRQSIPLVLSGDEIVWVVGHRISDRHKVTDRTRRTVRLTATPLA